MKKILINFAHPAKSRSNVNKALRKAVENIEGVTVNDLYTRYPDFMIDVEREKQLCETHDIIIFQIGLFTTGFLQLLFQVNDVLFCHH